MSMCLLIYRYAAADLGLDVAEHQISSVHLHDHVLGPEATFAVQPLQFGHAVFQRLQLPTVQLTGQEVLGGGGGGSQREEVSRAEKPVPWVRFGSHWFTSTLKWVSASLVSVSEYSFLCTGAKWTF